MSAPLTGSPLSDAVRALFQDLRHAGEVAEPAGAVDEQAIQVLCGEAGQVRHGTQVRFSLRIDRGCIVQARYRAYGCPHTLASCEWLARQLEGRALSGWSPAGLAAAVGGPSDWAVSLTVPAAKLGRLLVIEDALHAALGTAGGRAANSRTAPDSAVTKDA